MTQTSQDRTGLQLSCLNCMTVIYEKSTEDLEPETPVMSCSRCGQQEQVVNGKIVIIKAAFPYFKIMMLSIFMAFGVTVISQGITVLTAVMMFTGFLAAFLSAVHHRVVFFRPVIFLNIKPVRLFDKCCAVVVTSIYFVAVVFFAAAIVKKLFF